MKKPIQKFETTYIEALNGATPTQIARWLEDYRIMVGSKSKVVAKSKLISLKVPEDMLAAFRQKAEMSGVRYQTQIKKLMEDWLREV